MVTYETVPKGDNWRRVEIFGKRNFSRGDTVRWCYTTGQGCSYAASVPRHITEQRDDEGRLLIGGQPTTVAVGFPKGLKPRSVTIVCPENMTTRQVLVFSADAPLWTGSATTIRWCEGEDDALTYYVCKRTDEHWPGHSVRDTLGGSITDPNPDEDFDSSIEAAFWETWQSHSTIRLVRQHQILNYRLDFAHLASRTAIELDGYYFHADPEHFRKDRQRDRELSEQGWRVIRFAGDEIVADVERCVEEALRLIRAHSSRNVAES